MNIKPLMNEFKRKPEYMGFVLIVLIIALNILMQGSPFFRGSNMQTLFSTTTPLVMLTMAQCIVMISGNIDISTGITMSLVNVFAVMMPTHVPGFPVWAAYIVGYLLAVLVGFANGVLIGFFRIPPMLATYAMSFVVRGINLLISDRPQGRVAREFWILYRGDIFGVPNSIFIIIALILVWFSIQKMPFIKEIYAVGGDEKAAYLTGISTVKTTIHAYTIAGSLVGVGGILWTLMLASSSPISGDVKTLQSVAAALIGGTLISGGWGTMACGVLGAFFMSLVSNTTSYMFTKFIPSFVPGFSVSSYYQDFVAQIITMASIILAIVMSSRTRKALSSALRITKAEAGKND
jgi:ribose/xylose/arabinose/galactoside ABC-type transport system permease subunit